MGNGIYRIATIDLNVAPAHDPSENTINLSKGPAEWTVNETDVPGVYTLVVSLLTSHSMKLG